MATPLISVRNLHKWYSGVHALKGVDLDVQPREVCGLVGDNGAGKSTLIKILSGVHRPDRGEIRIDGHPVVITSPKSAMKLGIETIYSATPDFFPAFRMKRQKLERSLTLQEFVSDAGLWLALRVHYESPCQTHGVAL